MAAYAGANCYLDAFVEQQNNFINDAPLGAKYEESDDDYIEFPLGAAKCQLHETYIVSQTQDGLIIIDQHAVHERLVYEKMKKSLAQQLILPKGGNDSLLIRDGVAQHVVVVNLPIEVELHLKLARRP